MADHLAVVAFCGAQKGLLLEILRLSSEKRVCSVLLVSIQVLVVGWFWGFFLV